MDCQIEVLFTPAEIRMLRQRNLGAATCVVFDVLRATSTMVTALANGAAAILPVEEISEAIELRCKHPDAFLAGEREGRRIGKALTAGSEFDLGNSPREFTPQTIQGRMIICTTTNGTRALRACVGAEEIVVACFLNLMATANFLRRHQPRHLILICAGTGEGAALEDTLAAGALCDGLLAAMPPLQLLDSANIALLSYQQAKGQLSQTVRSSQNARRLLACADLRADVEYCLRHNAHPVTVLMSKDGMVRLR